VHKKLYAKLFWLLIQGGSQKEKHHPTSTKSVYKKFVMLTPGIVGSVSRDIPCPNDKKMYSHFLTLEYPIKNNFYIEKVSIFSQTVSNAKN
jgi:hypothetical protein